MSENNIIFLDDVLRKERSALPHNIPVGTRVDIAFQDYLNNDCTAWQAGVARLFVVEHTRDCDGTPLYTMAAYPPDQWLEKYGITYNQYSVLSGWNKLRWNRIAHIVDGYPESELTVVEDGE